MAAAVGAGAAQAPAPALSSTARPRPSRPTVWSDIDLSVGPRAFWSTAGVTRCTARERLWSPVMSCRQLRLVHEEEMERRTLSSFSSLHPRTEWHVRQPTIKLDHQHISIAGGGAGSAIRLAQCKGSGCSRRPVPAAVRRMRRGAAERMPHSPLVPPRAASARRPHGRQGSMRHAAGAAGAPQARKETVGRRERPSAATAAAAAHARCTAVRAMTEALGCPWGRFFY